MRKVLIVSPHFAPVNAPDMHRVRLALPYLRELGWEPVVLCLDPATVEGAVFDPLLETTYPHDLRIVRVKGISPSATRWAGFGNLWLRVGRAFARAGERLLAAEKFDLVFISTTQFSAFGLGPRWKRRFGVPYVLDYQDPWINPYYRDTKTRPPGGRLKFALSQWTARRIEPQALREAGRVVSVSPAYSSMLAESYPWFDPAHVTVLPFGAAEADFAAARSHRPAAPLIDFDDGCLHFVYAGRGGAVMAFALRALFRAFQLYLENNPADARRMRFHFIGTDYAPPPLGRECALPLARELGIEKFVTEQCERVPYFDALHYLQRADAVLAIGSDDPGYSASKIYPCILARRPLLLVYHEKSPVLDFARRVSAGTAFSFADARDHEELARRILAGWFGNPMRRLQEGHDETAFRPFTAAALTTRLAEVFEQAAAVARTSSHR